MFNRLQKKFSKIFNDIRGHGKISEENISKAIREIRIALLESDVNYKVVSSFINRVKDNALGAKVFDSITPGQQFIKIVLDELIDFLSSDQKDFNFNKSGTTFLVLAGLQGSGKTTTSAKIASFLKREFNKKPLLVAADLERPAAIEQLRTLSKSNNIDFYSDRSNKAIEVVANSMRYAKTNNNDLVIIDTAGRLHTNNLLMDELDSIITMTSANEILYVADGMTGQDAVNSSKLFSDKVNLTGVILTKMDGDSGGGVALSVKEVTGCPIKFITTGESINKFEKFNPDSIARRILGLSDILGLVEKAQKNFDQKNALELEKKIISNQFNFNDFSNQLKQFSKLGSLTEISSFIPGLKKIKNFDFNENQFKWLEAIIGSMTNKEKENPSIINGSRRARIAKGSGRTINEVNRLIKQFNQLKSLMKKTKKMKLGRFPFKLN